MAKGKKTGGRDFKPGESGNPHGAHPLPPELKSARQLTRIQLELLINRYVHMTKAEIIEASKAPNTTALELMIASLISRATNEGDYKRIAFLLDRLGFVVTQKFEHGGVDGKPISITLTTEEKRAKLKRIMNQIGEVDGEEAP